MSAVLNNVTAPDAYTAGATLQCPDTVRVRLQVNNGAVYWQRGIRRPGAGGIEWPWSEEFLLPTVASLDEVCDVIRVRAAVPAADLPAGSSPAQVTVTTRTAAELGS